MEFKDMYAVQKNFQDLIMKTYSFEDREKFLKDLCIHLNSETFEVLGEINWKTHRREKKTIDESRLLFEMVDVLKYAMSLPASWGFTAEQIEEVFMKKSRIIEQKFRQEVIDKDFSQGDKIIGVDIDGVLLNYPEAFIDFVAKETKTEKDITKFAHSNYNIYDELASFLGLDKETLKALKHKFRSEGHKQNMKPLAGAAWFINRLQQKGFKVILLSARPVEEYPNLFYDTIVSLNRAEIPFDGIYFSDNKEVEILKRFPTISYFVEDCGANAEKIAGINKPVFLLNKTYNTLTQENEFIVRCKDLSEILAKIN